MSVCSVCKHGWRRTPLNWGKSGYARTLCDRHRYVVKEARRSEARARKKEVPPVTARHDKATEGRYTMDEGAIIPTDAPAHEFVGRRDRWCEVCNLPDRHPVHVTATAGRTEAAAVDQVVADVRRKWGGVTAREVVLADAVTELEAALRQAHDALDDAVKAIVNRDWTQEDYDEWDAARSVASAALARPREQHKDSK